MTQSRLGSFIESTASTLLKGVVSFEAQLVLFPMYGIPPLPMSSHVQITAWFIGISIVLGYVIRRLFAGLHG